MEVIENRHFIRHSVNLPLKFNVLEKDPKKNQKSIKAKTINVSLGGLLFPSKDPVDLRSKVMINIPFENKIFNVKAQVVRCIRNSETKLYEIAINFLKTQETFKTKMIEQMYHIAGYREMLSAQSGRKISLEEASLKWSEMNSVRFKEIYR